MLATQGNSIDIDKVVKANMEVEIEVEVEVDIEVEIYMEVDVNMEVDIEVEVGIEINMEVAGTGRDTTQTFHIFISFLSCVIHTSTGA